MTAMRTRLGVLFTTAVLLTVVALPGTASAATFTVLRTPAGGPDGTRITVQGVCDQDSQVSVTLESKDSDAIQVFAHGTFPTGGGGTWHGSLNVAAPNGNGPADLDLISGCGQSNVRQPFFLNPKAATGNPPTVVTALAGDACGFGLAPTVEQARIPCPPHVKGFNGGTLTKLNIYADNGTGGASVAVGDIDGDGTPEVIVGSGPGHAPMVWIATVDGTPLTSFAPYDVNFKGGVNVAAADLNGDGKAEIITGAGSGGGPHVRIFDGKGLALGGFFAYVANFHGGVNVAAGDVNGDGKAEIVTGAGPGGGPHVRTFDAAGNPLGGGFFAYDPRFVGGVSVAAGTNRIVTGAGPGGGPHVRLFDGAGNPSGGGFFAYDGAFLGGVWVALGPNGIVTGPGSGGGPDVRAFSLAGSMTADFLAYEGGFDPGVKVAALGPGGSGSTSTSNPGGTMTTKPGGTTTSG